MASEGTTTVILPTMDGLACIWKPESMTIPDASLPWGRGLSLCWVPGASAWGSWQAQAVCEKRTQVGRYTHHSCLTSPLCICSSEPLKSERLHGWTPQKGESAAFVIPAGSIPKQTVLSLKAKLLLLSNPRQPSLMSGPKSSRFLLSLN